MRVSEDLIASGTDVFRTERGGLRRGEILQPYQPGTIDISLTVHTPGGEPLKDSLTFLEIRPPERPWRDQAAESERLRRQLDEQVTRNQRLEALVEVLRLRGRE